MHHRIKPCLEYGDHIEALSGQGDSIEALAAKCDNTKALGSLAFCSRGEACVVPCRSDNDRFTE